VLRDSGGDGSNLNFIASGVWAGGSHSAAVTTAAAGDNII